MDAPNILLVFSVLLLSGLGILGCLLPVLPGPPLSYAAILIFHFAKGNVFSYPFLIITFLFVVAVVILDYVLPIYTTKRYGGSTKGIWGGVIGLVLGLFFSPFGFISIIIFPLLGAIIGDLIAGKNFESALRSGFGSFVGFIIATLVKLALSITLTVFLIIEMLKFYY
jgi:uncharacterized protein YqgC (DUF456 family)